MKIPRPKNPNKGTGYARNARNNARAERLNNATTEEERREQRIDRAIKKFFDAICEDER